MNYLPFVGYGFYGGLSSTETANYYASWGLMGDLPDYTATGLHYGSLYLDLTLVV